MPPAPWGEGPLAKALHGATEPNRALLLAALLQQAQHVQLDVQDAAGGMNCVQLRLDLSPAAIADVLRSGPSPQAMTALSALIGLAAI